MPKKPVNKKHDMVKRYEDLLEIARLVSWCMNRDYLIKTCLDHISKRLGKQARCILVERDELTPHCRLDGKEGSTEQGSLPNESIVWHVLERGTPVNFTEERGTEDNLHALSEEVKIEAIAPFWYVDQLTQEEKIVGALIIDSNGTGTPISPGDFEYLKLVGELIGGAVGKAELAGQLIEFYRRKEAIVKETAHNFRNRITAIGGLSQRLARLAKSEDLAKESRVLYRETQLLQEHLKHFEKYIDI